MGSEQLVPLRREHDKAAEALKAAREQIKAKLPPTASLAGPQDCVTPNLTAQLSNAQEEHVRATRRYSDLEAALRVQMRELKTELKSRNEDVRQRCSLLQHRKKSWRK